MPKILIIEDSKFTSELIKTALEKIKCEVIYTSNGKDGIKKARKEHPDLIILDVIMPELNGFEVCDMLKKEKETCSIPIMLFTVKDTLDDLQEGFKVKADYYMTKPFTENLIAHNVSKILQERGVL